MLPHDERLAALVIQGRPGGWRRSRLLFSCAARRRSRRLDHVLEATPDELEGAAAPIADDRAVFDAHTLEALDALEQHLRRQRLDDHPRNDTDAAAPVLVTLDWLATSGIGAGGGFCRPRLLRWARGARRRGPYPPPPQTARGTHPPTRIAPTLPRPRNPPLRRPHCRSPTAKPPLTNLLHPLENCRHTDATLPTTSPSPPPREDEAAPPAPCPADSARPPPPRAEGPGAPPCPAHPHHSLKENLSSLIRISLPTRNSAKPRRA